MQYSLYNIVFLLKRSSWLLILSVEQEVYNAASFPLVEPLDNSLQLFSCMGFQSTWGYILRGLIFRHSDCVSWTL